jgi:hypothetical protein
LIGRPERGGPCYVHDTTHGNGAAEVIDHRTGPQVHCAAGGRRQSAIVVKSGAAVEEYDTTHGGVVVIQCRTGTDVDGTAGRRGQSGSLQNGATVEQVDRPRQGSPLIDREAVIHVERQCCRATIDR